jgi:hypothetical protein
MKEKKFIHVLETPSSEKDDVEISSVTTNYGF